MVVSGFREVVAMRRLDLHFHSASSTQVRDMRVPPRIELDVPQVPSHARAHGVVHDDDEASVGPGLGAHAAREKGVPFEGLVHLIIHSLALFQGAGN